MSYKRVIGVDVSSKKLDISDSLNELPTVIDNTVDALGKFVKQLSDPQNEDALTCQLIDQILETLKKQLKSIDSAIKKFIEQLSKETPKVAILSSVPCVGPVTTATLCCELPELGEISRTKIAKLAGVAPMVKQSGESEGKRRARGGRSTVRRALYMSALVGTQSNPVIREFYLRLLKKGKPKKLALLACMRKLLLILHDMVRTQQSWDPARKANGQAVANLTTGSTCSASC